MARFRKIPATVDAWQWTFRPAQDESPAWVTDALGRWPKVSGIAFEPEHPSGPRICVATANGVATMYPNDYLVRQVVDGREDLWPVHANIFSATYESAADEEALAAARKDRT